MTNEEAKQKVLNTIIYCEMSLYTTLYGPDTAVVPISNLICLIQGLTKYRARIAIKDLIKSGLIEYKSQGCPAIVSFGEYEELVCEAGPPINGYCLTKKAFESDQWKKAYADWCKSMEEWADGKYDEEEDVEDDERRSN